MSSQKNHSCGACPSLTEGIFCHTEQDVLNHLSQNRTSHSFKKGQTLFVQGSPSFGLYCINKGNIKLSKIDKNGKETIVRLASKGDVLGHRSIFAHQNYSATATAIENTSVCFFDKKFILNLIEKEPSIAIELMSKLSSDMGAAEIKMASFHQKNVRERLAELLLIFKESHGSPCKDGKIKLSLKLTREEMASIIGTAPETLIRFLSEFKEEKLIEQQGKIIYIVNEKGLIDISGYED